LKALSFKSTVKYFGVAITEPCKQNISHAHSPMYNVYVEKKYRECVGVILRLGVGVGEQQFGTSAGGN